MRIKLTLAYDGRAFEGSQSQIGGNTVQDHLERALESTAKQSIRMQLAGRTDAGVHAMAQTAHFDAPATLNMNPYNWVPAFNSKLPPAIRVMHSEEVPTDFHARYSAKGKIYIYRICTLPVLPPLLHGLVWHVPKLFDRSVMEQALATYVGRHDFRYFAAVRGNETVESDFHRTIHSCTLTAKDDGYEITYIGDGFFYKMIRLLTGAALACAQGKVDITQLERWISAEGLTFRDTCSHCAPADGLTLEKVIY